MADVPFYLQGTQTAGLLSPSIPAGFSQTTPYFGDNAPGGIYPQGTSPGQGGTFNATNYSGLTEWERNKLASIATGRDFFMTDAFMNSIKNKYQDPLTVIGQGEAWLSPDELGAKTNALQTNLWSGGGSGGGGGGGTGSGGTVSSAGSNNTTGQVGGGLLSGGFQTNSTGASPGSINPFPNISGSNPSGIGAFSGGGNTQGIPGSQVSGGQTLPMSVQNGLNNYYNTPGYQLTNGQGAVNQFQTSPGYQFAVDQALGQVQRQGASRGLLDSGAGLRAMTDRAQGMANQEFNNWQTNQQNQYQNYQNRLQGLAGGPTGAEMAYNLGQGVGANTMQNGSNVGSLLANQGNSLFGGIVGAGGAQAQNVNQAGNMQAQILSGNLQTQMMLAALAAGQQGVR
jgi:hypothetical protein